MMNEKDGEHHDIKKQVPPEMPPMMISHHPEHMCKAFCKPVNGCPQPNPPYHSFGCMGKPADKDGNGRSILNNHLADRNDGVIEVNVIFKGSDRPELPHRVIKQ